MQANSNGIPGILAPDGGLARDYEISKEETKAATKAPPVVSKEINKLVKALDRKGYGYCLTVIDTGKAVTHTNIKKEYKELIIETIKRADF